jgi:glucose-1-phosphate thymidylyltransferase
LSDIKYFGISRANGSLSHPDVIALIPAAGQGQRVAPIPCSKELYPIGFYWDPVSQSSRPKVVIHYLLERLHLAGIYKAFVILREGKWDIPSYTGNGARWDMHLAYLMVDVSYGSPYSLDQAWPFVRNARIALGFPDIIFSPEDAFVNLLRRQEQSGADVVLGLFPSEHPQKMDMVDADDRGHVRAIIIKPQRTTLRYSWMIAVWTPAFTQFMHDYLAHKIELLQTSHRISDELGQFKEVYVGDVICEAMTSGMRVESETFGLGNCIDIGTPKDLEQAIRKYANLPGVINANERA